ncbi:T9SS type B sorting domain-containing protein [Flavobacterium noncentrifugens]|uniref:Gliding motility-associated C-terminal domain-containing protein n=1 Tax=Flavobacterium noncentrifugens TaxID=1128970 RepID=A0A1G8VDR5_9FLAO|nr:choice-of-anchor L domain-containing protein [Flavobacterium noncentrifugens]SDJ64242.1 gliding motility-associated C-terminal domain-containing protein [Flavobacterium noncentrifugens]
MKRTLLLFALMFAVAGFSQSITVNTSTYTIPQLVNSVLINSPCVNATNITWKTGTNYGSSNGIGFFQNTNPNFPIPSGVIISTGDVAHAPGPNNNNAELEDGSASWPGDSDLEATLAAASIPMNSVNATVLEFDFLPKSPNFSFDFLFASEEYGNYQCEFSDAFAFLLTNTVTGETKNLAVVPGTTAPISVITIRDFLYNSGCPSVNSQFFGAYNGGISAAASPTSYNGQTTLLNASAVLVPNTPYHIKLVIADRDDYKSDSAIFIASDSFNIGQNVLGPDITIASQAALCYGDPHTINSGLDPLTHTFDWKKDGQPLPDHGPSLGINGPGRYELIYQAVGCQPVSDVIKIEYYPQIVTGTPVNLYKCNSGAATYNYDLTYNTTLIKTGMNPGTVVTYHSSYPDAQNGVGELPLNYPSAGGQTIYARVKSYNTTCYTIKQFDLGTAPAPVANRPPDMTLCARSTALNNGIFLISDQTSDILGTQDAQMNLVSYYTSEPNALAGNNELTAVSGMIRYIGTNNSVIYVRVQNASDRNCFSTTSFTLFIKPLPLVDKLLDVIVCSDYTLPPLVNGNYFTGTNGTGTPKFAGDVISTTQVIFIYTAPLTPNDCSNQTSFKVTILDPNTLSPGNQISCGPYRLPALVAGNYFTEPHGGGTRLPVGTAITETQTLYANYTSTNPVCEIDAGFTVTVVPVIDLGTFSAVFSCTSYTLPTLSAGKYFTLPGGQGSEILAGTVITTTQTVYVFAETTEGCKTEKHFDVVIGIDTPADVYQCNGYTLPTLRIGNYFTGRAGTGTIIPAGTVLEATATVYIYVPTSETPNCTDDIHYTINIAQPPIDHLESRRVCDGFTLPPLTNGEYYFRAGGIGTPVPAGTYISIGRTIYIFKRSTPQCYNESSFVIIINPKPAIDSRGDLNVCNSYTLTTLDVGKYYTGPGGTGDVIPFGTVLTTSQRVYIYAVGNATPAPACSAESSFFVSITVLRADKPADVVECDSYRLPALTIGNYYTLSGGPSGGGIMKHAGDLITTSQTLYVFTENNQRINCTDENSFNITIHHTPVVAAVSDKYACNSYTLPALTVGDYYTGSLKTGRLLHAGDVLSVTQTIYVYAETGTTKNCFNEKSFKVTIFNVDEIADVTICESYTLPPLTIGKYYTGQNGTGTNLAVGSHINTTQTIYVYARSPFTPTCYDESSFIVTIVDTPIAHPVTAAMTTVCDEDGTNDGVTAYNLTQLNATLLGSQTGTEFTVTYFANPTDAATNANPITSTTARTAVARVSNTLTANCFDLRAISITVHKLPEPKPLGGIICYDSKNQVVLRPYKILSGLGTGYTFEWFNSNDELLGTASSYTAVLPGDYYVIATSNVTGCPSEETHVTVAPSEPALVSYTITDDFVDSQVITVQATGVGGDYEYQLDFGPFQDSPVFENVSSGFHTVHVRDKNGCGMSDAEALVINYPKFFTPNGDGFNDTWNIVDLKSQATAKINIFDRYGKFISQITPSGAGWDGTLHSKELPSTDYWFVVNYEEDGIQKEFKAHFAMKR